MKRRDFIALLGGATAASATWPLAVGAKTAPKIPRIGYIAGTGTAMTGRMVAVKMFGEHITRINDILGAERGELKLRDLIEGESERMVDTAIAAERTDINSKIGAQDARSDEAAATMKSFEDRKFQKTIKDRYFQFMKQFITEGGECRGAGCRASRVGFGVPSNTVNHAGRRP